MIKAAGSLNTFFCSKFISKPLEILTIVKCQGQLSGYQWRWMWHGVALIALARQCDDGHTPLKAIAWIRTADEGEH